MEADSNISGAFALLMSADLEIVIRIFRRFSLRFTQ